jgi:hypothetical protein
LPKETWLLEQLAAQLQRERNVLVYIRHTGNRRFVARLQRLLREHLQITAAFLDATKVPPHTREDWIRQAVVGMRRRVLLVNPEAVKTGLNCLTPYFKTVIWYELTYNTLTYRQANGRVHRIGADPAHPIEILVPVYAQTAQEIALDLQARKLTASLQLDAGSVESALQAAGAGGQDAEAALQQLAMSSMGQAIFEILSGTGRRENTFAPVPVPVAPVFAPLVPPPPAPVVREHLVAGPQLSLFDNLDHGASAPPATSARRAAPAPDPPRAKTPKQGTLFG